MSHGPITHAMVALAVVCTTLAVGAILAAFIPPYGDNHD